MPRTRWTPEQDAPLLDAVFDPALAPDFGPLRREQIGDVRAVFVERLGWSRERLAGLRFAVLAAAARRTPEVRLVQLRPPGELVARLQPDLLEAQLRAWSDVTVAEARAQLATLFTPEVTDTVETYRIHLPRRSYELLRELAPALLGAEIRPDDHRQGNPDLSLALERLIRTAHDRLS